MPDDQQQGKRRGRPRRDGSKSANQRAEIAAAALTLFSQHGYAATSMSSIARSAGLDQSSLYYWFSSKDAILRYLLESNQSSLRVASDIGALPGNRPAQLYAVLHADVLMLCRLPFDYYMLEDAATAQPERFSQLDDDYRALVKHVADIIEAGIDDGSLTPCDAHTEANWALAMNEGIQHRLRRQSRAAAEKNEGIPTASIQRAADTAAARTVASLLAHGTVAEARAEAKRRNWIEA